MKISIRYIIYSFLFIVFAFSKVKAQCTWHKQISDGFEYTTVCSAILPGTTYHIIPQTFSVHSGTYSLYMNMQNCAGGAGVCSGDLFYRDTIEVCQNVAIRLSAWLTTTFQSPLSDVRITIEDANNVVLSNTASIVAPLTPSWIKYQSDSIVPTTSLIYVSIYTNIDGGNGNDLSMDDFLMEICSPVGLGSTTLKNICTNESDVDLYSSIPGTPLNSGTWNGPSTLSGGYLGTFTPSVNSSGTYIYSSEPFGGALGCPSASDTVITLKFGPPVPKLGNDTTICTNQFVLLNPRTNPTFNYLWSNLSTTQTIVASTISTINDTITYSVKVTDTHGCNSSDTIQVIFEVCSALNELNGNSLISVYPNPAHKMMAVKFANAIHTDIDFVLIDAMGRVVLRTDMKKGTEHFDVPALEPGVYFFNLISKNNIAGQGKLMISK